MPAMSLHSLPNRLLFRLRHGNISARFRTLWLRMCGAKIGGKTVIPRMAITWPHQVQIGSHCILEPDIFFKFDGIWCPGPSIIIGDGVFIGRGCEFNIKSQVKIGNNSLIASGAKFIDHDHGVLPNALIRTQPGVIKAIEIGADCWIGVNVVVLKDVVIGDGAVIGAGAIVTRPVPEHEIWAGVPAKKIGNRK